MKNSQRGEKYIVLTNYLKNLDKNKIRLTFADIENIIGFELPPSARKHPTFWCHPQSHTLPYCFKLAGYQKTDCDIHAEYVDLEKI